VQPVLKLADRDVPAANVLVTSSDKDTVARVGSVRVFVAKGSAAFIVNNGRDVLVLGLHEQSGGDVSVLVSGQEVNLRAGEQVLLTGASGRSSQLQLLPNVALRGETEHKLSDGNRAFVSEFSIPSAINTLDSLKNLARSSNASERAVFNKILKNAAALQMLLAPKGPYKRAVRTGLMANAN
jgi:hypothetical protein